MLPGKAASSLLGIAAGLLLAGAAFTGGYLVHGSTHIYTRTIVTRTVNSPPKVIIRYRTRVIHAKAQPTEPSAVGAVPGGIIVNCNTQQCTSLPGAGPNGTTCDYSSAHPSWEACYYQ